MIDEKNLQQRMQQIEILTQEIEALPDQNARTKAVELMQLLMEYHGAALERVMEIVSRAGTAGSEIFDDLSKDELAASVLLLYGLHPLEIEERVVSALERVRPFLKSRGGDVELLGVEDGIVRLNLFGNCNGYSSASESLKQAIEKAIYEAAPDIAAIKVENAAEQPPADVHFVQIVRNKGTQAAEDSHSNNNQSFVNIV